MSNDYTNELLALNEELGVTASEDTAKEIVDCDDTIQITDRDINMPADTTCAVCCDSNSQLLTFEVNRYVENVDLSTKTLSIKFQNALKQSDRAEPHSVGISDDKIIFTWLLDKRVTAGEGTVTFQIEFYEVVNGILYSWQTKIQTFKVLPTLDVDGSMETPSPTWVQEIQSSVASLESMSARSTAISDSAIAFGTENIAGLKGYYIKSIDIKNKKIYLTDTKLTPVISTDDNTDLSFQAPAYAIGDVFSLILKPFADKRMHYHCIAAITSITNNVIGYDVELPFKELYADDYAEVASPTLSVVSKPNVGIVDISSNSFAVGILNTAAGEACLTTGSNNIGAGKYCLVFGMDNIAAYAALAGGSGVKVLGNYGVGLGTKTIVMGERGLAAGHYSEANGENAVAFGESTDAHAKNTLVSGKQSAANGENAVAFGLTAKANGDTSLALGQNTFADGVCSIVFGLHSKAIGPFTVAGGYRTEARNTYSIALGYRAIASADYQVVLGKDNIIDTDGAYLLIVGNGTGASKKHNAYTLDKDGNGWFAGDVTVGPDNKKLATEDFVKSYIEETFLKGAW